MRPPPAWRHEPLSPDEDLRLYRLDSDIAPGSPAHAEVSAMLAGFGLDVVAWRFQTAQHSVCGWAAPRGGHRACPALTVMMRRTRDFAALGISDDRGNWDDGWVLTGAIRSALNVVLARYGLTTGYQSETTFIFVHSWEERAFHQLGKLLKSRLSEIVISLVPRTRPPKVYFGSYWGNEPGLKGQFNLLFPDEASMQQALPFRWDIRTRAKAAMRLADRWGFCEDHDVGLELYYAGMRNLPPLYRED